MSDMKKWIQLMESASTPKYTGRETKQGTWHVFQQGESVAAAGPFKSAQEANEWIRSQETTNEAHGNVKEDEHQFSDGDRVKFTPEYDDGSGEVFTLKNWDGRRGWVVDDEGRGWSATVDQLIPVDDDYDEDDYDLWEGQYSDKMDAHIDKIDELRQLAGLNENYGVPGQPEKTGSMSISKQEGDVTVNISASGADMAELMAIMRKYGGEEEHVDTPCGHDDVKQPDQPVDEIAPVVGAIAGGVARAGAGMAARSLGDTLRDRLGMNQHSDQG
jgi:hypothetical protein